MPNAEKKATLDKIREDLANADAVWVVDYRGLSVKQSEALRAAVRAQGAALKIYKNSFTEIALRELGLPEMGEILEGPSAFVFVNGDPVSSAKALKVFAKENDKLQIKGGLLNKGLVTADQVKAIADLPSREELIAKLLGTLNNPLIGIARVLNGPAEKFVRTLSAIAESKAA